MAMAGGEQWIAEGSSEIMLEVFVFSLALHTVLLNYSAGSSTVSLISFRAAARETLFHHKRYRACVACLNTFKYTVIGKGVKAHQKI